MPRLRHLERIRLYNVWTEDVPSKSLTSLTRRRLLASKHVTDEMPETLQRRLVSLNSHELVDAFYVIRIRGKVIYVSETILGSASPEFAPVLFPTLPLSVANSLTLAIGVYVRVAGESWQYLLRYAVNLNSLVYTGPPRESIFRTNAVALMVDGSWYSLAPFLKAVTLPLPPPPRQPAIPSYTFDTIRTLLNLTKSLREVIDVKLTLLDKVTGELKQHPLPSRTSEQLEAGIKTLDDAIDKVKNDNDRLQHRILANQMSINQIKGLHLENRVTNDNEKTIPDEEMMTLITPQINQELTRLVTIVNEALPTNADQIAYLPFPQSVADILEVCYYNRELVVVTQDADQQPPNDQWQAKIDQINAGLSAIAKWIDDISTIVEVKLLYPVELSDDHYCIVDAMASATPTKYPLHYDASGTTTLDKFDKRLTNPPFELALALLVKTLVALVTTVTGERPPPQSHTNVVWMIHYLGLYLTGLDAH